MKEKDAITIKDLENKVDNLNEISLKASVTENEFKNINDKNIQLQMGINELETENKNLKENINTIQFDYEKSLNDLLLLQQEISTLKFQLNNLESDHTKELCMKNANIVELESDLTCALKDLELSRDKCTVLENKNVSLEDNIIELKNNLLNVESKFQSVMNQAAIAEANLLKIDTKKQRDLEIMKRLNEKIAELQRQVADKDQEYDDIENLQKKLQDTIESYENIKKEKDGLDIELNLRSQEIVSLKIELKELQEENNRFKENSPIQTISNPDSDDSFIVINDTLSSIESSSQKSYKNQLELTLTEVNSYIIYHNFILK
jgi:DNA repair exonuclease SbcCD ATPase subunit